MDYEKLSGDRMGETSEAIQTRVQVARNIQLTRFANIASSNVITNADMRVTEIRQFCKLQDQDPSLMRTAMTQLNLSAHAYDQLIQLGTGNIMTLSESDTRAKLIDLARYAYS